MKKFVSATFPSLLLSDLAAPAAIQPSNLPEAGPVAWQEWNST